MLKAYSHLTDMPRGEPLYDENTICLFNLGPTTRAQVELFICKYLDQCNVYETGLWRINMITNSHNEYIGSAYVYFSDKKLYHLLLGNNPDGSRRVVRIPNPYYGEESNLEVELQDIDLNLEPYIEVPYNKNFKVPMIELDDSQLESNGFNRYIEPEIVPCVIRDTGRYPNILICDRAPTFMTERNFYDLFSFYVKNEEDKDTYPIIKITDKGRSSVIEIIYPPGKLDAMFASVMTRKVKVLYGQDRLYVLSFKLKVE